jgi:hypothetical protein
MDAHLQITYAFDFPDGQRQSYTVACDRLTLTLRPPPRERISEWTMLEYCQCPHCPLLSADVPQCPVAANIEQLIDFFKDKISYKRCTVTVTTEQRTFLREASIQEGLFGIMGLIMATSQCPHMQFLRPMAFFHLPFSSMEETVVRTISFYLLKQYFIWTRKGAPDWQLAMLDQAYQNVRIVNEGMLHRIRSLRKKGDADLNALIILDDFAASFNFELAEGLQEYEHIFLGNPVQRA